LSSRSFRGKKDLRPTRSQRSGNRQHPFEHFLAQPPRLGLSIFPVPFWIERVAARRFRQGAFSLQLSANRPWTLLFRVQIPLSSGPALSMLITLLGPTLAPARPPRASAVQSLPQPFLRQRGITRTACRQAKPKSLIIRLKMRG
jgi:hypothetical protein